MKNKQRVKATFPPDGKAKIAFVGEAPGKSELRKGRPLVGYSGVTFNKMLKVAGIIRNEHLITNLFDYKLEDNDVATLCVTKKEVVELLKDEPSDFPYREWCLRPIAKGKYLPPKLAKEALDRLKAELLKADPNIVVPMGATALWAIMGGGIAITNARGGIMESLLVPGLKCIPTYHPAYIGRVWAARVSMLTDLAKIKAQMDSKDIQIVTRTIWVNPTLDDLDTYYAKYLANAKYISVDIETYKGQVESIAFSPDRYHAIVVPFINRAHGDASYWETAADEVAAVLWCRNILEDCNKPLLMQNGPYDAQWLWTKLGIKCYNYSMDTRLLHHALYPELPKSLAFMGAAHETEKAWKGLRHSKAAKPDE